MSEGRKGREEPRGRKGAQECEGRLAVMARRATLALLERTGRQAGPEDQELQGPWDQAAQLAFPDLLAREVQQERGDSPAPWDHLVLEDLLV